MEVLFDRICRENGIRHLLTAPRSPTTTGKIERFHGTLRRELLTGTTFPTLATAQQAIDVWIAEYNTDRPHQSLGGCTPAERFATRTPDTGPTLDLSALAERHTGEDWISRRVASNGIISVTSQPFSVGKHHSGEIVDVHVTDRLLEVWAGNDLIKTIVRTSPREIRKKRAERTARTRPEASSITRDGLVNHQLRLDSPTALPPRVLWRRRSGPGLRVSCRSIVRGGAWRGCAPGLAERSLRRRHPAPVTAAAP